MSIIAQFMNLQNMDLQHVKNVVNMRQLIHKMPLMQSIDISYTAIDIHQILSVMPLLESIYANSHLTGLRTLGADMFR